MKIDGADIAGLYFMGPAVDIGGDVTITNTPRNCLVSGFGPVVNGSLTQTGGTVLTLNGAELNGANFNATCR